MLPVLLIHGFPFDGTMWQAQAEFLRSAAGGKRTVFTPDLPGFGKVPGVRAPSAAQASIEAYAHVIHQVIESQCGGRAIAGGFSMGGYVLLALARQHPADIAGAMFIDTRADADSPEARANRLDSITDIQAKGTAGFFTTMVEKLLRKESPPAVRQRVRGIMERQSSEAVIAAQSAMAKRRDQTDLLPELSIPALIVVGAEDAVTPPTVAIGMQGCIPRSTFSQIPGAGHLAPMEQPDAVNDAMRGFLASFPV